MLKQIYVRDILEDKNATSDPNVTLSGRLKGRRKHGSVIFLEFVDSTGEIQAVVQRDSVSIDVFNLAASVSLESALELNGTRKKR